MYREKCTGLLQTDKFLNAGYLVFVYEGYLENFSFRIYTSPNNVLVPLFRPQKPEVFGCNLEVIIWKNLLLARIF
jgi:hypothetical protein